LNGIAKSCLTAAGSAASAGRIDDARDLYTEGCKLDDPIACLYAGQLWAEHGPADYARALELLAKGCDLGESAACYGGGLVAAGLFGGDPDMPRAAELHRKGCNLNLADSCTSLAEMLIAGEGVEQDESRGVELLEMACTAEEGGACIQLGARSDDAAAARALYEKACGFGDGQGCTLVALSLEVDADRASWFEKGCVAEVPDPTACTFAALPKFNGESPAEAVAVFEQTCGFGDAMGCFFLSVAARDGRGRDADADAAAELLERACELDSDRCEQFRAEFDSRTGEKK
jgi:TPR repeat protein